MTLKPITVVIATRRLQLFEAVEHLGVNTYPMDEDAPDADILVFPAGTSKVFLESVETAKALPERLRVRAASGQLKIVIDASSEGTEHGHRRATLVHQIAESTGAPIANCFYITQEINYPAEYAAWCAEQGIAPLNVIHHDAWIWRQLQQFEHNGEEVLAERLALFKARPSHRERRLVSLNHTPRPHKVMFLLRLITDGLWDKAFVSFGGLQRYREISKVTTHEGVLATNAAEPGFSDLAHEVAGAQPELDAYGRIFLDGIPSQNFQWYADEYLPAYAQSWFTVVTETEMFPRPSRITEKTMRALVNFHPFLVLGNPHALKAVRALGFQTFEEVFDESYDEVLEPRERFEQVYQQTKRLMLADEAELQAMEARVADKLVANAEWGLTQMSTRLRRAAFEGVLGRILAE